MRTLARTHGARARRGLTLIELVVAAGLLALLLAGLFKLLRDFLSLWDKSEARRAQVEEAAAASELLASDLSALEPGTRGDLLAEWAFYDVDGDGTAETKWPRIRFVRHAAPAEIARLQSGDQDKVVDEGLIEVIWTVLPANTGSKNKDLLAEGSLWRGERIYGAARDNDVSFFDEKYLSSRGTPRPGSTEEVTSGVLWVGMQFASQMSIVREGWHMGRDAADVLASWDAWNRGRANAQRHIWNEPSTFLPPARETPVLPRRARFEVEFERQKEQKLRTRVSRYMTAQEGGVEVDDDLKLPEPGTFILIDHEWMQMVSAVGHTANVRRAQRGTQAATHDVGAMIHYGKTVTREVALGVTQEDWNL